MLELYEEVELAYAFASEVMQVEAMSFEFLRHDVLADRSMIHAQFAAYDALGPRRPRATARSPHHS